MSIQYPEIAALVEAGKTPAEIHAIRQADPRTANDIPIGIARQLLVTEWGLIGRFDGIEVGPIADLYRALPETHAARDKVRQLISHLLDNNSALSITLTDPDYAGAFFALLDHPALSLSDERKATLAFHHGGRATAGETEDDIIACIQDHADGIQRADLLARRGRIADAALNAADNLDDVETAWIAVQAAWNGEGDNAGV